MSKRLEVRGDPPENQIICINSLEKGPYHKNGMLDYWINKQFYDSLNYEAIASESRQDIARYFHRGR